MKTSKFVDSIIEEVNPLELPKEDGTGYVWHKMEDCYVYVMESFHSIAPAGYVDFYLVIAEIFHVPFSKAKEMYEHWFASQMEKRYHLIEWTSPMAKKLFRKFLVCAHKMRKTSFDLTAFDNAFEIYQQHIKSAQLKIK